jgi:hypothetical protein
MPEVLSALKNFNAIARRLKKWKEPTTRKATQKKKERNRRREKKGPVDGGGSERERGGKQDFDREFKNEFKNFNTLTSDEHASIVDACTRPYRWRNIRLLHTEKNIQRNPWARMHPTLFYTVYKTGTSRSGHALFVGERGLTEDRNSPALKRAMPAKNEACLGRYGD